MKFFCVLFLLHSATSDYWTERDAFIKEQDKQMLGSSIILTAKEEAANQVLMTHKITEYQDGFATPGKFKPAQHFFKVREDIEASPVFSIIRKMPKGASLHLHDMNAISQDFFMNLTYRDNLYGCNIDNELYLRFLSNASQDSFCGWMLVSELREKQASFDQEVRSQFFLNVPNPREAYPDINAIWRKMTRLFRKYDLFLSYKPVFQDQFYRSLLELYNDSVKYCEFRTTLPRVYDLDGTTYSQVEVAGLYQETLRNFIRDHPDFIGARLIYVRRRSFPYTGSDDPDIQLLTELKKRYPDFFVGFDICGQEDLGYPTADFHQFVSQIHQSMNRFFHAGETNWQGSTDLNLVDALLLNVTRIGHGFALVKHPLVLNIARERNIPLEVCPISNQVLMLVSDLRNHPAVFLIASGYPIIIGNDNPTFWGVTGLTYDYYATFMGMTSKSADLRVLKKLVLNSWEFSVLAVSEREKALTHWQKEWEEFLDIVIQHRYVDEL